MTKDDLVLLIVILFCFLSGVLGFAIITYALYARRKRQMPLGTEIHLPDRGVLYIIDISEDQYQLSDGEWYSEDVILRYFKMDTFSIKYIKKTNNINETTFIHLHGYDEADALKRSGLKKSQIISITKREPPNL